MSQKLRNWLQRQPHPTKLRTDGGDTIVMKGRNKWHDAIATIEDLQPYTVEALNADGEVLRTFKIDDNEGKSTRNLEDPTVALSRVMMEVADRSAERHGEAYKLAFEAVVDIMRTSLGRLDKLERLYMGLVKRHAETIEDTAEALAEANGDPEDKLLGQAATALVLNAVGAGGGSAGPKKRYRRNGDDLKSQNGKAD